LGENSDLEKHRDRLDEARGYSEIWELVKDTVQTSLAKHRVGIMLFLDDLPLQLGAYHPVGTNNIILNRRLVQIVEASTKSQRLVNAFVYILLLHEYMHALGYVREAEARQLVYEVSQKSFGDDHIASKLARTSPWTLLENVPLSPIDAPKQAMEIVKDFEKSNRKYIV
jgi:hypothetical protein